MYLYVLEADYTTWVAIWSILYCCEKLRIQTSLLFHLRGKKVFQVIWHWDVRNVPASSGSSSGSGPVLWSSGTAPEACCVSVVSLPSLSASPPQALSPIRPAAADDSVSSAAPSSSAGCIPPSHPRHRRLLLHRDWRTTSFHRLPGKSAFCASLTDCRRWTSRRNHCGPDTPVRCPP